MSKEKQSQRLAAISGVFVVALGFLLVEHIKNTNLPLVRAKQDSSLETTPVSTPLPANIHNGNILRPTVVAYEAAGISNNFYPEGAFTQEMFDEVKRLIFRVQNMQKTCTATLIDDGRDLSMLHFLSSKHCSEDNLFRPWFFVNPEDNSLAYDPQAEEERDPLLDLMVLRTTNVMSVHGEDPLPLWNDQPFIDGIPLATSEVISGETVLVLGYPAASIVPSLVGGEDVNLISNGFPDAILLSAYAKVINIDPNNPNGGIELESYKFQTIAGGHSGCPVFKIEHGRLVLAAVVYAIGQADENGVTKFTAAPVSTVRSLVKVQE